MAGQTAEIGTAYISILPSTDKIAPGVKKALGGVEKAGESTGRSLGSKISSGIGKTLKVGAAATGATVGGLLAGSIAKGMGRLNSIDQANAKLEALGNTGEQVDGIMDNALASVKGTAFGIGEAAGTAATMVASGIKPGEQLESVLTGVADSASIAGVSMSDMGLIWGKVAAKGRLDGQTVAQMLERQIPIYDILSEKLGVASTDIADMVSKGKIDFETFAEAMNDYVGGGAQRMGDTVEGAFLNAGAAMGRFGAALIDPVFSAAPALISSFTTVFDDLTTAVGPAAERIGELLTPALETLAGLVEERLSPALAGGAEKFGELAVKFTEKIVDPALWERVAEIFGNLRDTADRLWPSIESLAGSFMTISQNISVAVWESLAAVLNALAPVIESVLVPLVEKVAEFAEKNPGAVQAMVMAFLGFKAVGAVSGPVKTAAGALRNIGGAFTFLSGAFKGGGVAKGLVNVMGGIGSKNPIIAKLAGTVGKLTGAFGKFWTILSPILKVLGTAIRFINPWVAGFTILTGALTYFFTQTETGKAVWQALVDAFVTGFEWMKEKAAVAWEFLSGVFDGILHAAQVTIGVVGTIVLAPFLIAWNLLSAGIKAGWEHVIKPAWEALSAGITSLWTQYVSPILQWISDKWDWLKFQVQKFIFEINRYVYLFQSAVSDLWTKYVSPILTWISDKWDELKNRLITAYNNIKSAVIDAFSNALTWFRDNVVAPVIDFFVEKWDWLKTKLHEGWTWIDTNVISAFRSGLEGFKSFFDGIVDGIGEVWETLRGKLARPINFMINTVYNNGILAAWETMRKILPGLKEGKAVAPIPGYARGGGVQHDPTGAVRGPGTGTSDSILARIANGEHIWTAREVAKAGGHDVLYAMRDLVESGRPFSFDGRGGLVGLAKKLDLRAGDLTGAAPGLLLPGFAKGGEVRPLWETQLERAHKWASARHGRPYVFGGSAHGASGTDCSGFMSGIADVIQGGNGARKWATMAFSGGGNSQMPTGPQGFVAGLGPGFSIGVTNGGPGGGHTAGTLSAAGNFTTVNVESGGSPSMVKYGTGAVGADHRQFRTQYHLPIGADGAFVSGGAGGFDFLGAIKKWVGDKTKAIFDKIVNHVDMPTPPPEWHAAPKVAFTEGSKAFKDFITDKIENLGELTSGVWGRITDLFDNGGWLMPGRMAANKSGKPEPILTDAQWRIFSKAVQALAPATEALNNAARGFQDWAKATEEQDRMGYPHEWAIHFGSQAATAFADDALSLVGLGGIAGGRLKPSLVNLLNVGADNLNDVYGTNFGHVREDTFAPVSLLDAEGRAVGTRLERLEEQVADIPARSPETVAPDPAAQPVSEVVVQVDGDAVSVDTMNTALGRLEKEVGGVKIRVEKLENAQTASVVAGVAGIV